MINKLKSFLNKGHKRTILAKKNILLLFFIKLFNMIIVYTMISVSIKYLGKENYGIWVVLSGLIAWSNVFDLGFSHGLRNHLAEAKAQGNMETGKYYVSTTYAFLIFVGIILGLLFFFLISYLDWNSILNTSLNIDTIRKTLFIVFSFFILQFIFKPIGSILEAYQLPAISQAISLFGSALALSGVFYLLFVDDVASLSKYAYFVTGAPFVGFLLGSLYFYSKQFKNLIPSVRYVKKEYFRKIAGLGVSFFIIQLSVLIIFQSDNIIISYLFGPQEVTNYNIVYRYFSIVSVAFGVVMAPFWTAFTDAYQKKDFKWIQKTMNKLFLLVVISIITSLFLFSISDDIYILWIDKSISISSMLSALMALYVVVLSFLNIVAFFSNGTGKIMVQLVVTGIAAIVNLPLSYYFGRELDFGVNGVLLATICCIVFIDIFLFIQYKLVINNNAKGIWFK